MHNWTNFCNIIKFNSKGKSLVAQVAAGLFLDEGVCNKLRSKTVFVVPPDVDIPRKFTLSSINVIDKSKFSFPEDDKILTSSDLVGKSLLLSSSDFEEVFGVSALKRTDNLIGKIVVDQKLGKIGEVKDLAGTSAQKHLVVVHEGKEELVPFVDEFIKEENENEIIMDLPTGVIGLNEV